MSVGQPLRGLVGQSMSGLRSFASSLVKVVDVQAASGSWNPTTACEGLAFVWGAGGTGASNNGGGVFGPAGGGGGGAFGFKRFRIAPGQTVSWVAGTGGAALGAVSTANGNAGGDSTLAAPGLGVLRAGGGQPGTTAGVAGSGGVATGSWDLARKGGAGGAGAGSGTGGPGESPAFGGTGGTGGVVSDKGVGGGGGSAGYTDGVEGLAAGNGSNGNAAIDGGYPGGGSSGTVSGTGAGGNGRVFIIFIRVSQR